MKSSARRLLQFSVLEYTIRNDTLLFTLRRRTMCFGFRFAAREGGHLATRRSYAHRLRGAAMAAVICLVATTGVALAVPIDPNLSINASIEFAFGDPAAGGASQSGEFTLRQGGADTTSTIASDTSVTGDNPLSGALTDLGDGIGAILDQSGSGVGAATALGLDYTLDITNNSVTDTIEVTVVIDFLNRVDAGGTDAFAEGEFTFNENTTELFFTDLVSDTVFGDQVGGDGTGTFGELQEENGMEFLVFSLLPGANLMLSGTFDLEGESFGDDSSYIGLLDVFVSIGNTENVTDPGDNNVPLPGTLLLIGIGLTGLSTNRWLARRSKRD
ncbi:MAG: hypothetical protein GYB67_14405 [Chloroflexi bacterium]|nr:hypothetical protein [Chloroflexota bacterium]